MLGRKHEVGGAVEGIGRVVNTSIASGRPHEGESQFGSCRLPYPGALRVLYLLAPRQGLEALEQLLGVRGDAQEPLTQLLLLDDAPERSAVPSARTCSLASTVWSTGSQFTSAVPRTPTPLHRAC